MAAKKIMLHQNDYGIKLLFNIKKDNIVEPLTNAKVLIKYKDKNTGYEFDRYATITDENNAECEYILKKEDLATIGTFITEVETTYGSGVRISEKNPFILVVQEEVFNKTE